MQRIARSFRMQHPRLHKTVTLTIVLMMVTVIFAIMIKNDRTSVEATYDPLTTDTDGDGIVDAYDTDDDGDGLPDEDEDPNHENFTGTYYLQKLDRDLHSVSIGTSYVFNSGKIFKEGDYRFTVHIIEIEAGLTGMSVTSSGGTDSISLNGPGYYQFGENGEIHFNENTNGYDCTFSVVGIPEASLTFNIITLEKKGLDSLDEDSDDDGLYDGWLDEDHDGIYDPSEFPGEVNPFLDGLGTSNSMFHNDTRRTGQSETIITFTPYFNWIFRTTLDNPDLFNTPVSSPVIHDGVVYVAAGSSLIALDEDGVLDGDDGLVDDYSYLDLSGSLGADILWTTNLGETHSTPTIFDDKIYVAKEDGICCLYTENGSQVWSNNSLFHLLSSPLIIESGQDASVYVATDQGVFSFDSEDGSLQWSITTFTSTSSLTYIPGRSRVLICGMDSNSDYALYEIDASSGNIMETYELQDDHVALSTPTVYEEDQHSFACIMDANGTAHKIEVGATTTTRSGTRSLGGGEDDWSLPLGDSAGLYSSPTIYTNDLGERYINFHTTDQYHMVSEDGELLWSYNITDDEISLQTGSTFCRGTVYVNEFNVADIGDIALVPSGDRLTTLHQLDTPSPVEVWNYSLDGSMRSSPVTANGKLYFSSFNMEGKFGPQINLYSYGRPFTSPLDVDSDDDNTTVGHLLDDRMEVCAIIEGIGTNPFNNDTDYDQVIDGTELAGWTYSTDTVTDAKAYSNPLLPDSDFDGLSDGFEYCFGLDAGQFSTDTDDISDFDELFQYTRFDLTRINADLTTGPYSREYEFGDITGEYWIKIKGNYWTNQTENKTNNQLSYLLKNQIKTMFPYPTMNYERTDVVTCIVNYFIYDNVTGISSYSGDYELLFYFEIEDPNEEGTVKYLYDGQDFDELTIYEIELSRLSIVSDIENLEDNEIEGDIDEDGALDGPWDSDTDGDQIDDTDEIMIGINPMDDTITDYDDDGLNDLFEFTNTHGSGDINIALGANNSADMFRDSNYPRYAVDGNLSTFWQSYLTDTGKYTIDLNAHKRVNKIHIIANDDEDTGNPLELTIEYSDDDIDFTAVSNQQSSGTDFNRYVTFDTVKTQYVRLNITRTTGHDRIIIREIELFEPLLTNPVSNDTDGDGLFDGDELYPVTITRDTISNPQYHVTNPCKLDSDSDGLFDGDEIDNINLELDPFSVDDPTDPTDTDTDDDGMPDGYEVVFEFDPTDDSDASQDADNDDLTNLQEFIVNTLPYDNDSDDDGIEDGDELIDTKYRTSVSEGALNIQGYRIATQEQWLMFDNLAYGDAQGEDGYGFRYSSAYRDIIVPGQDGEPQTTTMAFWHFNEKEGIHVFDESTNRNTGTLGDGVSQDSVPIWITGETDFGSALFLDGVDDVVSVPDSDTLDINDYLTIETWIKITGYPATESTILEKKDAYSMKIDTNGKLKASITGTTGTMQVSSTNSIPTSEWTHIAVTFNKDHLTLNVTIDGDPEGTTIVTSGTTIYTNVHPMYIGARDQSGTLTGFLNVSIDELRISNVDYNTTGDHLSDEHIEYLLNVGQFSMDHSYLLCTLPDSTKIFGTSYDDVQRVGESPSSFGEYHKIWIWEPGTDVNDYDNTGMIEGVVYLFMRDDDFTGIDFTKSPSFDYRERELYTADPLDADTDDDHILDINEVNWDSDSDNDGMINADDKDSDNDRLSDSHEDLNQDGIFNLPEAIPGTNPVEYSITVETEPNPTIADSNDDGIGDYEEYIFCTVYAPGYNDDNDYDTDNNGDEQLNDFYDDDDDDDGLEDIEENLDLDEYLDTTETSPVDPDSDDDELWDGYDVEDYLGYFHAGEQVIGRETDPLSWDTDGDGLSDSREALVGTFWFQGKNTTLEQTQVSMTPEKNEMYRYYIYARSTSEATLQLKVSGQTISTLTWNANIPGDDIYRWYESEDFITPDNVGELDFGTVKSTSNIDIQRIMISHDPNLPILVESELLEFDESSTKTYNVRLKLGEDAREYYIKDAYLEMQDAFIIQTNMFDNIPSHSHDVPAFVDLDNDNDLDLVIGKKDGTFLYYENAGNSTVPYWQEGSSIFSNPFDDIDVGNFSAPAFVDLDGDYDYDLVYGNENGEVKGILNQGDLNTPVFDPMMPLASFNLTTENLENIDVGSHSKPTFVYFGQGQPPLMLNYKLVVGNRDGFLEYYAPVFGMPEEIPTWAPDHSRVKAVKVSGYASPAFGDMDDDDDPDLIVGEYEGTLTYYENTGNGNWELDTSVCRGIYEGKYSAPALGDLDNDGDPDLTIGSSDNGLTFYQFHFIENQDPAVPDIMDLQRGGNADFLFGPGPGLYSTPVYSYLAGSMGSRGTDVRESGLFLVSGCIDGTIKCYEYSGNGDGGTWIENTSIFQGIDVGSYSAPTFIDLESYYDCLVVGNEAGEIHYYQHMVDELGNHIWTPSQLIIAGPPIQNHSKPTFADMDDDGDYDLIIGDSFGNVYYYENTQSNYNPEFVFDSNHALSQISTIGFSAPSLWDFDDDYDYDLFLGGSTGTVEYYVNSGDSEEAEFQGPDTTTFSNISTGSYSTPNFFVDDGTLFMIVGAREGAMKSYAFHEGPNNIIIEIGDEKKLLYKTWKYNGKLDETVETDDLTDVLNRYIKNNLFEVDEYGYLDIPFKVTVSSAGTIQFTDIHITTDHYASDPHNSTTDSDSLTDYEEVQLRSDMMDRDTDNDLLDDGFEVGNRQEYEITTLIDFDEEDVITVCNDTRYYLKIRQFDDYDGRTYVASASFNVTGCNESVLVGIDIRDDNIIDFNGEAEHDVSGEVRDFTNELNAYIFAAQAHVDYMGRIYQEIYQHNHYISTDKGDWEDYTYLYIPISFVFNDDSIFVNVTNISIIVRSRHTDLLDDDTDGDKLGDYLEVNTGYDPLGWDSDGDTIFDYIEDEDLNGSVAGDTDGDRIMDLDETWTETNALDADSDEDGVLDMIEIRMGLDPLCNDTDEDHVDDGTELSKVYDPNDPLSPANNIGMDTNLSMKRIHFGPAWNWTDDTDYLDDYYVYGDKDYNTTTDPLEPTTLELVSGSWYGNDLLWDGYCDCGLDGVPGIDDNGITEFYDWGIDSVPDFNEYSLGNPSFPTYHPENHPDPRGDNWNATTGTGTEGNGLYDPGETYTDTNANGSYDFGEPFNDYGADGLPSTGDDGEGDGIYQPGEPCDCDDDDWNGTTGTENNGKLDWLDELSSAWTGNQSAANATDGIYQWGEGENFEDANCDGLYTSQSPVGHEYVYAINNDSKLDSESDPLTADEDGDGLMPGASYTIKLPDGTPYTYSECDYDGDYDNDGLNDGEELFVYGTKPDVWDTDGDGIMDGCEVGDVDHYIYNELDYTVGDWTGSQTPIGQHFQEDMDPSTTTDPHDIDTDDDGFADSFEDKNRNGRYDKISSWSATTFLANSYTSNPNELDATRKDTDRDGMPDDMELNYTNGAKHGWRDDQDNDCYLDPTNKSDATADEDEDSLNNIKEVKTLKINPFMVDSDEDLMPDWWEVHYNSLAESRGINKKFTPGKSGDANDDFDEDGVTNVLEYTLNGAELGDEDVNFGRLDPMNRDSDGDGRSDGDGETFVDENPEEDEEYFYDCYWYEDIDNDGYINALDTDSDDDGYWDNSEIIGIKVNYMTIETAKNKTVYFEQHTNVSRSTDPTDPTNYLLDTDDDGIVDYIERDPVNASSLRWYFRTHNETQAQSQFDANIAENVAPEITDFDISTEIKYKRLEKSIKISYGFGSYKIGFGFDVPRSVVCSVELDVEDPFGLDFIQISMNNGGGNVASLLKDVIPGYSRLPGWFRSFLTDNVRDWFDEFKKGSTEHYRVELNGSTRAHVEHEFSLSPFDAATCYSVYINGQDMNENKIPTIEVQRGALKTVVDIYNYLKDKFMSFVNAAIDFIKNAWEWMKSVVLGWIDSYITPILNGIKEKFGNSNYLNNVLSSLVTCLDVAFFGSDELDMFDCVIDLVKTLSANVLDPLIDMFANVYMKYIDPWVSKIDSLLEAALSLIEKGIKMVLNVAGDSIGFEIDTNWSLSDVTGLIIDTLFGFVTGGDAVSNIRSEDQVNVAGVRSDPWMWVSGGTPKWLEGGWTQAHLDTEGSSIRKALLYIDLILSFAFACYGVYYALPAAEVATAAGEIVEEVEDTVGSFDKTGLILSVIGLFLTVFSIFTCSIAWDYPNLCLFLSIVGIIIGVIGTIKAKGTPGFPVSFGLVIASVVLTVAYSIVEQQLFEDWEDDGLPYTLEKSDFKILINGQEKSVNIKDATPLTNPNKNVDVDDDGLVDGFEYNINLDEYDKDDYKENEKMPKYPDNQWEIVTNPIKPDSDGDGLLDGLSISFSNFNYRLPNWEGTYNSPEDDDEKDRHWAIICKEYRDNDVMYYANGVLHKSSEGDYGTIDTDDIEHFPGEMEIDGSGDRFYGSDPRDSDSDGDGTSDGDEYYLFINDEDVIEDYRLRVPVSIDIENYEVQFSFEVSGNDITGATDYVGHPLDTTKIKSDVYFDINLQSMENSHIWKCLKNQDQYEEINEIEISDIKENTPSGSYGTMIFQVPIDVEIVIIRITLYDSDVEDGNGNINDHNKADDDIIDIVGGNINNDVEQNDDYSTVEDPTDPYKFYYAYELRTENQVSFTESNDNTHLIGDGDGEDKEGQGANSNDYIAKVELVISDNYG